MIKLTKIEKQILNSKTSLGNNVLYQFCKEMPLDWKGDINYTKKDALSAQMWLIGGSYAASPERRRYGKAPKIKFSFRSKGLDTYFDRLAEEMINHCQFNKLIKLTNELRIEDNFCNEDVDQKKGKYTFSVDYNSERWKQSYDSDILCKSVIAVSLINNIICDCRFKIDQEDFKNINGYSAEIIKNSQNKAISFSSKFLHFHAPNAVFIYDTISSSHIKKRNDVTFYFNDNDKKEISEIEIEKKSATSLSNIIKERIKNMSSINDCIDEKYLKHCVYEYILAFKLLAVRENKKEISTYIPRVIDTYVLKANQK